MTNNLARFLPGFACKDSFVIIRNTSVLKDKINLCLMSLVLNFDYLPGNIAKQFSSRYGNLYDILRIILKT